MTLENADWGARACRWLCVHLEGRRGVFTLIPIIQQDVQGGIHTAVARLSPCAYI